MSITHNLAKLKSLLLFLILCTILTAQIPEVVINEFLASNSSVNSDPDFGEYADWIELYNQSSSTIDLSGFFLTDNLDIPAKWQIPANTHIVAEGYLILWADGVDSALHTNFKLGKSGENIGLFTPGLKGVDSLIFGAQETDFSFGRLHEDINQWAFFTPPSPGSQNISANVADVTPTPVFSLQGGFHSGSQTISFLNADQVNIFFSQDGTAPDEDSTPYTIPIAISNTTPLRAIAYQAGKPPSPVITQTYFIDEPVNLPIISIATDPDNFFDNQIGIYVTGTKGRGGYCANVVSNVNQDWERPVNIELYETDGSLGINQQAGVKIFGGCSRHRFPQKSLSLFARSEYGKGSFNYKLFEEKDIKKFESFILRSSADDQVRTLFRDAVGQQLLVGNMDADYQAYQPIVLYINGEYWGIHNIREKLNEHYVAGNFNVNPDDVNILANDGSEWNTSHGSSIDYQTMMSFVTSNNMAIQNNYDIVKTMMDVHQYVEYMIGHIYLAERDWPGNNIKFWKSNTGIYNRWRWINFDLDQTLTYDWITENMINKTTTTTGPNWPNPEWSTRLFRNLLQNEEFKNEFLNGFAWHLNTTFDSIRVISIIDSLQNRLKPEIQRHIDRWGGQLDPTGSAAESWIIPTFDSIELWKSNVDTMRIFARNRQQFTIQNIAAYFGLSGFSKVNIGMNIENAGILEILTKTIKNGYSGNFFNDVPIQVNVLPLIGYNFLHWEAQTNQKTSKMIFDQGSAWKYLDNGSDQDTSWRFLTFDDSGWNEGSAELGYGDDDETTTVSYGVDENNKYITTYFRKTFNIVNANDYNSLIVGLLVDDGAVIYLNGSEIVRENLPEGEITYLTLAPVFTENESTFLTYYIPSNLLIEGTNIIAVEVHQNSITSSDLSFDCWVSATGSGNAETIIYPSENTNLTLTGDLTLNAIFEIDTMVNENPVVISEINYNSSDVSPSRDWIEIYNNSGSYINLSGWEFQDSQAQTFIFPDGQLFEKDTYLVICRDTSAFKLQFPSVTNILGNFDFGLSSLGERLSIVTDQSQVMDVVDYRVSEPWPTQANGTGYTIELPEIETDNSLGENWIAKNFLGTPGREYEIVMNIDDKKTIPVKFALLANYPNPFNPVTTLRYNLAQRSDVQLSIYNITGQKVTTLVMEIQDAGKYSVTFNASNLASGVYFYRLKTSSGYDKTMKMLLLK